jgi:hypothetical protein
VPTAFAFSTGTPDGRVATISEPSNVHNSQIEFESADDFALTSETVIDHASFTGLLTGGATLKDVSNVVVTIYRVFPNDSDVSRTSGPPTFSTPNVPTRVNSPGDNEIENRDSAAKDLNFDADVISASFTVQNSVASASKISVNSRGNGAATGEEVEFNVTFRNHPLDLPAGHYFFVPKVGLKDKAPAGADFLWLSAARPIVPPGTAFPAGVTDLQSWMREEPGLAPDWLRIGTDIIKQGAPPTFTPLNASFALSGHSVEPQTNHGDNRAPDLSAFPDLQVPAGNKVSFHAFGEGVQIYRWDGTSWVFVAPEAKLFADAGHHAQIGIHFAGPTWESNSGSKVVGTAPIAKATPDPDSIPWLKLGAASTEGPGIFDRVTFIQRVNTVGGKAPTTPGSFVGEVARVPYTADYFFYRATT